MHLATLAEIRRHALESQPNEACGFVVARGKKEHVVRGTNVSTDPTCRFLMRPEEYLAAKADSDGIVALYHSHVTGSAALSPTDKAVAEALRLPSVVYCVERNEWARFVPQGLPVPLLRREWYEGVQDCFSLVRDYFERMRACLTCGTRGVPELDGPRCKCGGLWSDAGGVLIPDVFRMDYWWEAQNPDGSPRYDYWRAMYADAGFVRVPFETLRPHDVLVMRWPEVQVAHHGAVYLQDGTILHHLRHRLSCREELLRGYQRKTELVLRWKTLLRENDVWAW